MTMLLRVEGYLDSLRKRGAMPIPSRLIPSGLVHLYRASANSPRGDRHVVASRSLAVKLFSQFVLGLAENLLPFRGKRFAGAVEIKSEHRHRRSIRIALPCRAALGRVPE